MRSGSRRLNSIGGSFAGGHSPNSRREDLIRCFRNGENPPSDGLWIVVRRVIMFPSALRKLRKCRSFRADLRHKLEIIVRAHGGYGQGGTKIKEDACLERKEKESEPFLTFLRNDVHDVR